MSARSLAEGCAGDVVLLRGGRHTAIEQVAVAASGVWVIASTDRRGRLSVRRRRLGWRPAELAIGGHDVTGLVDRLRDHVAAVELAVADARSTVPVLGAVCAERANLPLLGTPELEGVLILSPGGVARRLGRAGPYDMDERRRLAEHLTARLGLG